jgi:hypothetical protein
MRKQLTDLSFEEWLDHIFDHPVTDPKWYTAYDRDYWDVRKQPLVTFDYFTKAFENPLAACSRYSDEQVNQGLWYMLDHDFQSLLWAENSSVPIANRQRVIKAMYVVFEQLFLPRCSQFLATFDDPEQREWKPLNSACYMWWDMLRLFGDTANLSPELMAEALEVMTKILDLDSEACRESALHGLGHWHKFDPPRINTIIDNFLAKYPQIRPELATYALHAREGHVL